MKKDLLKYGIVFLLRMGLSYATGGVIGGMGIPDPFSLLGGKSITGSPTGQGVGDTAPPMSGLFYGSNTMDRRLARIQKAIIDFEPVRTQVIDLPTLNKANRIGGAMTITSV